NIESRIQKTDQKRTMREVEEERIEVGIITVQEVLGKGIDDIVDLGIRTLVVSGKKQKDRVTAQRRFKVAQKSAESRSRPPTKSQLRNLMMTYLKNMGGYKHSQLKEKIFAEIQGLFERQKRVIDDFKPMDSDDTVDKEKVLEEHDNTKVEVKQEGDEESIRKRPGRRLKMKAIKKSKR
nr:hypothetical protein [Tanacetum cinerariifolium]